MRLIDADALEKNFEEKIALIETNGGAIVTIFKTSMEVLLKDVKSQPTVEAKPIVHAKWESAGDKLYCSECLEWAQDDEYGDGIASNYCPACGAQMDESVKIPVISMEDVPKIAKEMENNG